MPVFVTGTTALSFTQQFLKQDPTKYVVGGQLYFYAPGTTTPITGYKDGTATLPYANPYTLASDGRIPQIYFIVSIDSGAGPVGVGYTSIRMRLTDANGVLQFDYDNIPLLGLSAPAGPPTPGPVIDPNGVALTGDLLPRFGIGVRPGWVRANGLTIGPLGSGATERAQDDCHALFNYIWNNDPLKGVLPFPGPDAATDWADGHKTIVLPDWSGCVIAGLDNMSGVARNILTAGGPTSGGSFKTPGQSPIVLGARGGIELVKITAAQLPVHSHPAFIDDPGHTHPDNEPNTATNNGGGTSLLMVKTAANTGSAKTGVRIKSTNAATGTGIDDKTGDFGGGADTPLAQPTKLCTIYIRL